MPTRTTQVRHLITKIMLDWHLYLVRCHDGSLYTGITTNVARRFAEHQENNGGGGKIPSRQGTSDVGFPKEIREQKLGTGCGK